MTKEEIAAKREEVENIEIQIAKAEFVHNLQKLNEQFAENPYLFDEVGKYSFQSWNEETCGIVSELRRAKKNAESGGEQSKKQNRHLGTFDRKSTYIEDEV